jgi:hypothetical protein
VKIVNGMKIHATLFTTFPIFTVESPSVRAAARRAAPLLQIHVGLLAARVAVLGALGAPLAPADEGVGADGHRVAVVAERRGDARAAVREDGRHDGERAAALGAAVEPAVAHAVASRGDRRGPLPALALHGATSASGSGFPPS